MKKNRHEGPSLDRLPKVAGEATSLDCLQLLRLVQKLLLVQKHKLSAPLLAQKLFPPVASRLCGWCRNCFRRRDCRGKQNLFSQVASSFCSWCRTCSHSSPQPLWPGVKTAPIGCRQALWPAPEEAASKFYGGCRSCLHRPETAFEAGGEIVSTSCQRVCEWCRNCFHRLPASFVGGAEIASQVGTVEGSRTCFQRLPAASAASAEPAPTPSPEHLRPGVKAASTGCRQALWPAPEQAASNVYGGCRSCLHKPQIIP